MEKLQLFQSIVETHEKSMDKLREENLSLQKAFDEVVNGTIQRKLGAKMRPAMKLPTQEMLIGRLGR